MIHEYNSPFTVGKFKNTLHVSSSTVAPRRWLRFEAEICSSISSSSGGYSCIHAAYGTVTLYESSWQSVGTQLESELTVGVRLLVGVLRHPPTIYIYIYIYVYTGCPRRKGPNFGRVFLRSNYTDITQNTYIQSSMVTEISNIEK